MDVKTTTNMMTTIDEDYDYEWATDVPVYRIEIAYNSLPHFLNSITIYENGKINTSRLSQIVQEN